MLWKNKKGVILDSVLDSGSKLFHFLVYFFKAILGVFLWGMPEDGVHVCRKDITLATLVQFVISKIRLFEKYI